LGGTSDSAKKDVIVQSYETERALGATNGSIFREVEGSIWRKLDHASWRETLSDMSIAALDGETRAATIISLVRRVRVSEY
jgi:hypothetical protein